MSKRVYITLADKVYKDLEQWATIQGRPVANLAGYLVEKSIEQAIDKGKFIRSINVVQNN